MRHKTIHHSGFEILDSDHEFPYQKKLTEKLDHTTKDFNQEIINEIVLWKVNRYAEIPNKTMNLINTINSDANVLDKTLTEKVLKILLNTKGIQLPMASTILRFKNKHIYQIIDQRVYRIIYPKKLLKLNPSRTEENIKNQIQLYFKYLEDLRNSCDKLSIHFEQSDRILYMADKRINRNHSLSNY